MVEDTTTEKEIKEAKERGYTLSPLAKIELEERKKKLDKDIAQMFPAMTPEERERLIISSKMLEKPTVTLPAMLMTPVIKSEADAIAASVQEGVKAQVEEPKKPKDIETGLQFIDNLSCEITQFGIPMFKDSKTKRVFGLILTTLYPDDRLDHLEVNLIQKKIIRANLLRKRK